jgi:hypothetical protein
VKKLLTDAYLLTGLRVRRAVAVRIFRGVRVMNESDTYLAIIDEGREKQVKIDILRLVHAASVRLTQLMRLRFKPSPI